MKKAKSSVAHSSPRIAHVNFHIEKERHFLKYVKYLSNPWHIMWRNFLAGTFQGLGFAIGTALLLTVIGFLFGKVLNNIPFFQNFSEAIETWVDDNTDY